jgi:ubiquinone/menaquinone biosynthesis C-methylase UbiE
MARANRHHIPVQFGILPTALNVFGVDVSHDTSGYAYEKYNQRGLEFQGGSILDINFPENFFDLAICFETIEHIQNPDKALLELKRVLKPKGVLIISSPNRKVTSWGRSINESPCNPFHEHEFSTEDFSALLKDHFQAIEAYGQRGLNKFLFAPFLKNIIHKLLPFLYGAERGKPELEYISHNKEYRYITVGCKKR